MTVDEALAALPHQSHRDHFRRLVMTDPKAWGPLVVAMAEGKPIGTSITSIAPVVRQISIAGPSRGSPPSWMADAPPEAMQSARLSIDGIRSETPEDRRAQALAEERLTALVNACPHRGCRISCQSAACNAGKGDRSDGHEATMRHCRQCVQGMSGD